MVMTMKEKELPYGFYSNTIRPSFCLDHVSVLAEVVGTNCKNIDPAILSAALEFDCVPEGLNNICKQFFEDTPIQSLHQLRMLNECSVESKIY